MNTQFKPLMNPETVSALMDGQLHGADLSNALDGMDSAEARERWLVYHVVGDVLRSTDLAHGRHGLDLAVRVTAQLQAEARPVVQAAKVVVRDVEHPAANDGVFRWKMVAGLASFVAVAAVGWGVWGTVGPQPAGPQLAQAGAGGSPQAVALVGSPKPDASPSGQGVEQASTMLRDPRLDELLAAHRSAVGVSALGNSAGFLRNATFEGPGR